MSEQQFVSPPKIQSFEEKITPGRFDGKTAIVTGAGSGIGRATALRIAKEGGKVVIADISQERIDAVIAEHPDLDLVAGVGSIAKQEDVDALFALVGGKVDCLVNNAGVMDEFQPVGEVTDAIWHRVFTVNVEGTMRMSRAAIPYMLEQGKGSIVNVASEAALRGSAAGVAYTASKAAVVGLTKSSSVMYALKGIRTNAVAPGAVMTNIEAKFSSALGGERLGPLMAANLPTIAVPEQLAAAICFLLSDDATNVSGAILPVDLGWAAI